MSNINVLREVVNHVKTGPADYNARNDNPGGSACCIMAHVSRRLFPGDDLNLTNVAIALGITYYDAGAIYSRCDNAKAIEEAERVLAKYESTPAVTQSNQYSVTCDLFIEPFTTNNIDEARGAAKMLQRLNRTNVQIIKTEKVDF